MRFRRRRPSEKWPRGPRFTVGSVTGVLIDPKSTSSGGGRAITRPMPKIWYVHDAAYCYRVVLETWDGRKARAHARQLNEEAA